MERTDEETKELLVGIGDTLGAILVQLNAKLTQQESMQYADKICAQALIRWTNITAKYNEETEESEGSTTGEYDTASRSPEGG